MAAKKKAPTKKRALARKKAVSTHRAHGSRTTAPARVQPAHHGRTSVPRVAGKEKIVSVLLAVFLWGFWSWLYTYKRDAWKFWTGLAISVLLVWTFIAPFGVWIWAIIDVSIKPDSWYLNY